MQTRILDLDGSVAQQHRLVARCAQVIPLRDWAPRIRLACRWRAFERFEQALAQRLGTSQDKPALSFVGSGDFHHVSLALLARREAPCNLLVLDNHPDWMRGVPLLHCGTWLYHAARLPAVRRIFHVGGEVDFDNYYRWMAPWPLLTSGKITVLPALRPFAGAGWGHVPHRPLRERHEQPARREHIEALLDPFRPDLAEHPLYVSLDKDVLGAAEAVVNWDSGHLQSKEMLEVLGAFLSASAGMAGMDVVGDWSPVRVQGLLRNWLHYTEHPRLDVDPQEAQTRNEALNLTVQEAITVAIRSASRPPTVLPWPAWRHPLPGARRAG
jgi:hypothetical protein